MDLLKCEICSLHNSNMHTDKWEVFRNNSWIIRHHPHPAPLLGWLLLDSYRHISGPIEFDEHESSSFGCMVRKASLLIRKLTDCDRVYCIAFGEGARHLHMHLIPRFGSDLSTAAWSVADHYRNVVKGLTESVPESEVSKFVTNARSLIT